MSVPSIKATAFQTVADDLQRLLAEGSLSPDALEVRLCAEDLPYLQRHWPHLLPAPRSTLTLRNHRGS